MVGTKRQILFTSRGRAGLAACRVLNRKCSILRYLVVADLSLSARRTRRTAPQPQAACADFLNIPLPAVPLIVAGITAWSMLRLR